MAWETRNGRGRYYTQSHRVGGKVKRRYFGCGSLGELAADVDAQIRQVRREIAQRRKLLLARCAAADALAGAADVLANQLAQALLTIGGYRQHHRGKWRRCRRWAGMVACREDVAWEASGREADLPDLLGRARCGDADAVPLLRCHLAARPGVWAEAEELCRQAEDAWLALTVKPGDEAEAVAVRRRQQGLRTGPTASPPVRLLARRVVLHAYQASCLDALLAQALDQGQTWNGQLVRLRDRGLRRHRLASKMLTLVKKFIKPGPELPDAHQEVGTLVVRQPGGVFLPASQVG